MQQIIDIVVPVFAMIALGYGVARSGYLSSAAGDGIADFVFKVAVPLLLFRSLSQPDPAVSGGFWTALPFLISYFAGVAVAWASAMIVVAKLFGRGLRASVIGGVAASFSNLVLLGIPLIDRAFGAAGLQVLFSLIAVHLIIMMSVSTLLMEYAARYDGAADTDFAPLATLRRVLTNLAVNPIVIGIVSGLLFRFTGLPIPSLAATTVDAVAQTTGPLALFALGMGLIKYGIAGNLAPAGVVTGLSLVVQPFVVYALGAWVLDLPKLPLQVAVLAAACPTGVNAYLFAVYFNRAQGLATNIIVLALLGSVVTLPLWLGVLV